MDVNYKRVNDTDGELTLRFSDYKELTRFLSITNCRSFALAYREQHGLADEVVGIFNRYQGKWYNRKYRCIVDLNAELRKLFKKYGALCLTQKNTNEYLLEILKSLKQMDVA